MSGWGRPDAERCLQLLPAPLFRQGDLYDVLDRLRCDRWHGPGIWRELRLAGLIVRTAIPIGRSKGTRCYWTRSHCRINASPETRRRLLELTRYWGDLGQKQGS